MGIGDKIVLGFVIIFIAIPAYIVHDQAVNTHQVCYEEGVVLDILSVNYRDATILTDKGKIILNQATVKDGDVICLRSGRVRNDEK